MAEKLNVLKARIKAVSSTHKITKTMDMIARSRTAKILTVEQGMRPFTQKLNRIVEDLSHSDMDHVHPLLAPKKKIKNIILFVVTSSRGLCGSYNTKIFDEAMERIRHHHRHGREVQLHVLGKKGEVYFEKQGIPIARKYPRIDEESTFDDCATVVQRFMHEYAVDNASRVEVIYTRYYTRVVHIPKIKSLIPMIPDEEDIEGHKIKKKLEYVIEPNVEDVLKEVVPMAIKTYFYFMLTSSFLSENAERSVAMRNATDNAERLLTDLKNKANRARQEHITNELLDIIGGSEAI
ncbi:ATP synthase F1 subunit gamma [Brachyspira hampsonii]|uniref:ATP synthase gamma chain n=1 Tax=Brachyspira hampsonii TaxID=1287055 RepID=A0AAC9TS55_9SPIR|nr:ATP synthase F1 subunit gamma [Brachyspira hampsonii]ASJ21055.1 ATP synthase F1 subunit gamma [Brachyspira hampsonii]ELV05044.1 F0F1-type ATP synthase subunit gamma [Brachyspira hampsonii 30599]MBW5381394.1 ATP synthase F1 subunit gamma [Brachyspira hampsonii]MBW5410813.1 ATP synthase F1 subunit gamma [Brachyspira hampsonii]OEJ16857.1 ATP synthase F1 subunit gamma [Brachyspira hampsonii]